jgi:hypothetical protein
MLFNIWFGNLYTPRLVKKNLSKNILEKMCCGKPAGFSEAWRLRERPLEDYVKICKLILFKIVPFMPNNECILVYYVYNRKL